MLLSPKWYMYLFVILICPCDGAVSERKEFQTSDTKFEDKRWRENNA